MNAWHVTIKFDFDSIYMIVSSLILNALFWLFLCRLKRQEFLVFSLNMSIFNAIAWIENATFYDLIIIVYSPFVYLYKPKKHAVLILKRNTIASLQYMGTNSFYPVATIDILWFLFEQMDIETCWHVRYWLRFDMRLQS
jgi:hypothetical protein